MRAHLGEFGIVVPKGIHNVERLIIACEQANLPAPAHKALRLLADQLIDTQRKVEDLTADIRADAKANEDAQRLQTIPGVPPQAGHSYAWRTSGATARLPRARWFPRCQTSPISSRAAICLHGRV
jgi:transposase